MSEIIKQPQTTKPAPFNWSNYERTYNNAIDLVAQCIGYHRKKMMPIRAIHLNDYYFGLFRAGVRVLMESHGQKFDDTSELFFDAVKVVRGDRRQFDPLKVEYWNADIKN